MTSRLPSPCKVTKQDLDGSTYDWCMDKRLEIVYQGAEGDDEESDGHVSSSLSSGLCC